MKINKFLILILLVVFPVMGFALQETGDNSIVETILVAVTPLIVMSVTELFKWMLPKLPGIVVLIMATVWSSVIAWAYTLLDGNDLSWLEQFLYGLLAIVVDQFGTQLKNRNKSKV